MAEALSLGGGEMGRSAMGMAQTARARRRRAAARVLPEDLVVWEILVRVPAKTLLRCRAVCRSWRRLTTAADFLLAHHRRQPLLPLVSFSISRRRDFEAAVDALDLWGGIPGAVERRPLLRIKDKNGYCCILTVHASCDGLLVVSRRLENTIYICNPATRQWAVIPELKGCRVAALYHHGLSGEYRIVFYWGCLAKADYYVLTLGSSLEPRHIGRFAASDRPPILLHNRLHWHVNAGRIRGILVFDTILESLKCMRTPAMNNSWCHAQVLDMDGMLGISCIRGDYTMVDLCVLQDYETKIWSLKRQLELPVAELRSIGKSKQCTLYIVSDCGDMLVVVGGDDHLFYCDSKGKLVEQFHWDNVCPRPTGRWFKESLIQHPFLQRQNSDVHVEQPPFFRGLH